MNINRYNYEEYFLLYIDNELSVEDRQAVESFIKENQDLAGELAMLQQAVMRPEKQVVFTNKEALMRSAEAAAFINETNCEEYFILYIDNELSAPEKAAVDQYRYRHPESEQFFNLLQKVKLQPERILFPGKDQLYKQEEDRKVFATRWWKMAAAAMVILVAGWLWSTNESSSPRTGQVAELKPGNNKQHNTGNMEQSMPSSNPQGKSADAQEKMEKKTPAVHVRETDREHSTTARPIAAAARKKDRSTLAKAQAEKKEMKIAQVKLPQKNAFPVSASAEQLALTQVKREGSIKASGLAQQHPEAEIPEDNTTLVSFASDARSENVFLTNIPIDGNMPLRGLRRKASRVINTLTSIKNGSRRGISIGNVEIAIQ